MKQVNLKKQLFIASTLIMLLVLIIAGAVIIPGVKKIRTLHQTIFETHKALEREHEKTKHVRKSLRELTSANDFAKTIDSAVLESGKELAIITELERLSEKHTIDQTINISIQQIEDIDWLPAPQLKRLGITECYTISLLNQGTFDQHIAYLHDIQTLPYYILIDDLRFQRRGTEEVGQASEISLRFDGYIFIQPTKS